MPITVTADQIGTVRTNVIPATSEILENDDVYLPDVGPFSQITEACTELAEIPSFCAMKY